MASTRITPADIDLKVDDREPPNVGRALEDYGFRPVYVRLLTGDITATTPTTGRTLGVERKKWGDLLASVRRRQPGVLPRVSHLHWQARQMLNVFDISVILLDGLFRPTDSGGIRLPSGREVAAGAFYQADNALLSLQQRGILVAHCLDSERMGERLMKIIMWADKGEFSHKFGS